MTTRAGFVVLMLCALGRPAISDTQTASDGEPPPTSLTEIVVTAQKRSEGVNSVPLSIAAISNDELAGRGVMSPTDLEKVVPGFTVQKTFLGEPIFFIRGVGFSDTVVSINPAVSIYVDEVPLPFSAMARGASFDLERVEVLKGPQGTLFGENSTGGLVDYISARPTDTFQSGVDVSYGRFNALDASGFVSGPLAPTLTGRLAVQTQYQDDWQRSLSRPDDTRGQRRFNNAKAKLDFRPDDAVRVELTVQAWQDRSDVQQQQFVLFTPTIPVSPPAPPDVLAALGAQRPAPNDARVADWDSGSPTARNDRFYQTSLRADIDLPSSVTLTSITDYAHLLSFTPIDADGTPYENSFIYVNALLSTLSQEIRLSGKAGSNLDWIAGGNLITERTEENQLQDMNATNDATTPFPYHTINIIDDQHVNTYAGFGGLDYQVADAITLRGSLRYTKENRTFDGCLADTGDGELARSFGFLSTVLSGSPTFIAPGSCITFDDATAKPLPNVHDKLDESNVSWRTGIDWKPMEHELLYATVAKGYKSGSFSTVPAVFASQDAPVKQESVLAYELGFKSSILNRSQLNGAVFYYDYSDKQLQGYDYIPPFGNLPTLVNIPKSSVKGAEFDLTTMVLEHLRLQLAGTYLDTRVKTDPANPVCPITAPGAPCSFVGEAFPNTPKFQATADLEQRFALGDGREGYVGASGLFHSETTGSFGSNQSPAAEAAFHIPGYALLDLRAGITFDDGKWLAELWGRNVTNKFYLVGDQRSFEEITRFTGMPATYGVRARYRF